MYFVSIFSLSVVSALGNKGQNATDIKNIGFVARETHVELKSKLKKSIYIDY